MGDETVVRSLNGWVSGKDAAASSTVVEIGRRLDCAKNGCDSPHSDDGEVTPYYPKDTINGHAVTFVERTVTYSDWTPTDRRPTTEKRTNGA